MVVGSVFGAIVVGGLGAWICSGIRIAAFGTAIAGSVPAAIVGALLGAAAVYMGKDAYDRLTGESNEE